MTAHRRLNHLLADIKGNLPGVVLGALFLLLMTSVTGKVCPIRLLFGIPCPACGLTRAAVLLLRGNLKDSLAMNPFLLPFIAEGILFCYERYIREKKATVFSIYIVACILFMNVFYLLRMKYWFPNRPPMVYEPDNLLHYLTAIINL